MISKRMFLVGMSPAVGQTPAMYRLILETENFDERTRQSQFQYNTAQMNTQDLVAYMRKYPNVSQNVTVMADGSIKGTQGDLSRYDVTKNNVKVILGEVRDKSKDELLGYRVASLDGSVRRVSLVEMLKYCNNEQRAHRTPVANAKFICTDGKRMHLRSYESAGFRVEYINVNRKNKHAQPVKVDNKEAQKRLTKIEDIFSKEQIAELKQAKAAGVDIRIIANNKLSPEQMHIIWECEANKLPGRLFADPSYSVESMKFFQVELETGGNIKYMLNPKYNDSQLFEISLGYLQGVNVNEYSDPKNSAAEMSKIRENLANKAWHSYTVLEGSLGKATRK